MVLQIMKLLFPCYHLLLQLFTIALASAKNHGNPANEIVNIINTNRTAHKLPSLRDNPGLACMALQYIKECKANCTKNNTVSFQPPEEDFTEVFAPDCGVELPTVDIISGRIVGCRSNYLKPLGAFSDVLVRDKKNLAILRDKQHTEIGVGVIRGGHRGPFFWGVLFSSGQTNSTFVLEGGTGIKQKKGCFSGTDLPCSYAKKLPSFLSNPVALVFAMLSFFYLVL